MKQEAEEEMSVLCTKPNDVYKFVKFMRKEGRDIEDGGCKKNKDGKLVVVEVVVSKFIRREKKEQKRHLPSHICKENNISK